MSSWLAVGIACVYLVIAIDQGLRSNVGLAIMWASYAMANIGLAMVMK